MSTSCGCATPVPQQGSFEAFPKAVTAWQERLQAGLSRSIQATDQTLGHLEEEILQKTQDLERALLEEAAQKKADQAPPLCPVCGGKLSRVTPGHERSYQTRFGVITIRRLRGWCRRCKCWRFPADHLLGLAQTGSCSPGVQEMAALVASKLPVGQASAVLERLTGVKLPRATLDREARRQGRRAQEQRQQMDEQMSQGTGAKQQAPELRLPHAPEPFTLVIELDAWNIRERNDQEWGRTEKLRQKGQEPDWWHWVYGGTCFRLSQRVKTAGGRSLILSRGTVMTRGGIDELKRQLWAEAMRQGLGQAQEVLIIADGAVWIWNLATDRFAGARQRLDPWHALQHLWAVAHALYPEDETAAAAWIKPLKDKLLASQAVEVIAELDSVLKRLRGARRQAVQAERNYLENNRQRLDYQGAKERGEPLGSGAMESTCKQYQVRFHRSGQFWTIQGDEALMCLETFWRNARWSQLFSHVSPDFDPSKN
ncbi:MAG TPA: ISKra4 family transposase [Candidatus Sulfotelmatobacter sp.]|nr:ISKra4 family transposase [Candidatus Sulfotelmatobacter sp.]